MGAAGPSSGASPYTDGDGGADVPGLESCVPARVPDVSAVSRVERLESSASEELCSAVSRVVGGWALGLAVVLVIVVGMARLVGLVGLVVVALVVVVAAAVVVVRETESRLRSVAVVATAEAAFSDDFCQLTAGEDDDSWGESGGDESETERCEAVSASSSSSWRMFLSLAVMDSLRKLVSSGFVEKVKGSDEDMMMASVQGLSEENKSTSID